jgi:hypothetical protein
MDFMKLERDIFAVLYYFSDENEIYRPTDPRTRIEAMIFNATGSAVNSFPHMLYDCYYIAPLAIYEWKQSLHKFRDLYDFESGFLQNFAG